MLNSFIFILPAVLLFLAYLQIHRAIPCLFLFFNPLLRWWSKISNSCKLFLCLFFVRINGRYIFPWIIKNRTLFARYHPIFTFDLGYTKAEYSLLFILEGGLFRLIVRAIFTVFNINVPLFISWKPYVVFIKLTCRRWSTDMLYVDLIKENKLGGCQRCKLLFVVPGCFMSYFHLLPIVNYEQDGEG